MADSWSRIFLLSHMRAFTSLAGHILGSHPLINGYYELHIGYEDAQAPARQLALYTRHDALKPGSRYLFDKLLHNDYRLYPERIGVADVRILVALREPAPTVRSIIALFARTAPGDGYATPAGAVRYYTERLEALAEFCRVTGHGYYYYDAELLQERPAQLLPRLARWLELDTPLSEHYSIFSQTGKPRLGDSSPEIRSGHIDRTLNDYPDIPVAEVLLERARRVYRDSRARIVQGAMDAVQGSDAGAMPG